MKKKDIIMIWIGFTLILLGSLIIQKRGFEVTTEQVEHDKNIRISKLKNKLERYERIIEIFGDEIDKPNMSLLGKPHYIEDPDLWNYDAPSIWGASGFHIECNHTYELTDPMVCCDKSDFDYIKYVILVENIPPLYYGNYFGNKIIDTVVVIDTVTVWNKGGLD